MNKLMGRFVFALGFFSSGSLFAAQGGTYADQIIENIDSSKTFVRPWVMGDAGAGEIKVGIRQGIRSVCRLFEMEDYFKDFVVWSTELRATAKVSPEGGVGVVSMDYPIESITCISNQYYTPKITAATIDKKDDGSIIVTQPWVSNGPSLFPIHSGHLGGCLLLGYKSPVKHSLKWSTTRRLGVSLALDGQIYSKELGTFIAGFGCRNKLDLEGASNGAG